MDRNTITGLLIIFAIIIGFSIYQNSRLERNYTEKIELGDSLYNEGQHELARVEFLKALSFKPNDPAATERLDRVNRLIGDVPVEEPVRDTVRTADPEPELRDEEVIADVEPVRDDSRFGAFSVSAAGEERFITIENDLLELVIATKGGRPYSVRLKEYKTSNGDPLILFDGDSTVFGFNFFTVDNRAVGTGELFFTPDTGAERIVVPERGEAELVMRAYAGEGKYIEYVYSLKDDDYMVGFDVRFVSLTEVIARNQNVLSFNWQIYAPQQERGRSNEDNYTSVRWKFYEPDPDARRVDVDGFRERSNREFEEDDISTRLRWVAFKSQFFSSVIISDDFFANGTMTTRKVDPPSRYLRFFTAELGVPYEPGRDNHMAMRLYLGPNHIKTLEEYGVGLEELVFVGRNIIKVINRHLIINVFNILNNHIANYGIIILILTILIKLILSPLTYKSYKSTARMRLLKPKVDEINAKYKKPEDAMKKQQAVMALYKKAGVNPLGGCLPLLLQMPFLFAMFRFFPTSIELRQESFLWADDLSTYDSILDLPFTIPMYGDHVSLFTLLMTVSTILTMRLNTPATGGQEQMPGMKMMMYIMPVMFLLILNNFSSGLTYYYFLANIITFGQNMITKKLTDEEKILRQIEERSKKPVKKSKWQKRLEEAARKRGHKMPGK